MGAFHPCLLFNSKLCNVELWMQSHKSPHQSHLSCWLAVPRSQTQPSVCAGNLLDLALALITGLSVRQLSSSIADMTAVLPFWHLDMTKDVPSYHLRGATEAAFHYADSMQETGRWGDFNSSFNGQLIDICIIKMYRMAALKERSGCKGNLTLSFSVPLEPSAVSMIISECCWVTNHDDEWISTKGKKI